MTTSNLKNHFTHLELDLNGNVTSCKHNFTYDKADLNLEFFATVKDFHGNSRKEKLTGEDWVKSLPRQDFGKNVDLAEKLFESTDDLVSHAAVTNFETHELHHVLDTKTFTVKVKRVRKPQSKGFDV